MKEEILSNIKKEINKVKKIQKAYQEKLDRIKELEKNEVVREYLDLVEEVNNNRCNQQETGEIIIESIFSQYSVEMEETNKILIYLGTYAKCDEEDIDNEKMDSVVSRDNPQADYRMYADLEMGLTKPILVDINEADKFEQKYNVIVSCSYMSDRDFHLLQREFLKDAVAIGQEKACKNVYQKLRINN